MDESKFRRLRDPGDDHERQNGKSVLDLRREIDRREPWRMAAIISATVSACGSAAMKVRRSVPGAANTTSIAANRFSSASSERRARRTKERVARGHRAQAGT